MKISQSSAIKKVVVAAVLGAVSILLGVSGLGLLPWFGLTALTLMHVPVIIGAIMEGSLVGAVVGLIFGLFSMFNAILAPRAVGDLLFSNPLLSVLPRIVFGFLTGLLYSSLKKPLKNFATPTVAFLGSIIHTFLVLGTMLLLLTVFPELSTMSFKDYAEAVNSGLVISSEYATSTIGTVSISWLFLTIVTNGIPEAVVAALITMGVIAGANKIETRLKKSELAELE